MELRKVCALQICTRNYSSRSESDSHYNTQLLPVGLFDELGDPSLAYSSSISTWSLDHDGMGSWRTVGYASEAQVWDIFARDVQQDLGRSVYLSNLGNAEQIFAVRQVGIESKWNQDMAIITCLRWGLR